MKEACPCGTVRRLNYLDPEVPELPLPLPVPTEVDEVPLEDPVPLAVLRLLALPVSCVLRFLRHSLNSSENFF